MKQYFQLINLILFIYIIIVSLFIKKNCLFNNIYKNKNHYAKEKNNTVNKNIIIDPIIEKKLSRMLNNEKK